ncbi:hypothetical protein [Streptomyces sp. NPDC058657]
MPGLFRSQPETLLITLSDREGFLGALRTALDAADATDRPGLERALAVVETTPTPDPAVLRGRWALERIEAAGVEARPDSVKAVKALRDAEPGLSLLQAVNLTKEAAALAGH